MSEVPVYRAIRSYNIIKGRIAESIVENLFERLGYDVMRFGIEHTAPEIAGLLKTKRIKGSIIQNLSGQPDFVVRSRKHKVAFFVEVKYRTANRVQRKVIDDYSNPDIVFIFVQKGHIYCIKKSAADKILKERNYIQLNQDCTPLADFRLFKFTPENTQMIESFTQLTNVLFDLPSVKKMKKRLTDQKYNQATRAFFQHKPGWQW